VQLCIVKQSKQQDIPCCFFVRKTALSEAGHYKFSPGMPEQNPEAGTLPAVRPAARRILKKTRGKWDAC
jgi:hypothetical protein